MRIYFLGIAGTAMGNAALLLRALGHEVIGSDKAIYPPMSVMLEEAGIEALSDYDPQRLENLNPDLVVVGNAFSRGNSEVEFLLESRRFRYASLPETLHRFILSKRNNIVVTGTHGKTTTTSIAAHLLEQAGLSPGYLIGGAPIDPPSGWSNGSPEAPFVIEGDEYDSAFFDKRSKFIHYAPNFAIVNNLEFDHADIFRDLEDVKRSFSHFLRLVPSSGCLLLNGDDDNVLSLLPIPWTKHLLVGRSDACDIRIRNYEAIASGSRFEILWKGRLWQEVEWGLSGLFNARNAAMASLAAALASGNSDDPTRFDLRHLASFRGVQRRQSVRATSSRLTVIEDFGHHPTSIKETLVAMRNQYKDTKILAAFEPRSNTSRLEAMRELMHQALSQADEVVIGEAKSGQSEGVELMDTFSLADSLNRAGIAAKACNSNDEALRFLKERISSSAEKVLVVFFSNGSFGGIIDRFVDFDNGY